MLKPPVLPPQALLGGKFAVGASWLFGLVALLSGGDSSWHSIGLYLLIFLAGSHALELVIYSAFLKAAKASPADYIQVALFGIFHSGGMTVETAEQ